jgi:16S rRNA (guanine966-N2)-methyltransferase
LCRLLAERGILSPRGRLYLEQDRLQSLPDLPPGWNILKNKTAGNVRYALVAPGNGDTQGEKFV